MSGGIGANGDGTRIMVRVQPRASRSAIEGWQGDTVRVRLAAPPVDGAANDALIELLAERLEVAKSRITIMRGHASRTKAVQVTGLSPETVLRRLSV